MQFYIREQDKMSLTTRLNSLILQQYKIGFKVELRNTKVMVVVNGIKIAYEDVFSISRKWQNSNANNVRKCVPHAQHAYFSVLHQSNSQHVASLLQFSSLALFPQAVFKVT